MHLVFLLGAAVMALAFVLVLFIKEVPLRSVSGIQAQAQAQAAAAAMEKAAATKEADAS
jgi:hypothetical protein